MSLLDTDLAAGGDDHELRQLARQVREWQAIQRPTLSDNALVKRFAGLGSTKTYKLILDGHTEELDVERQLHNYQSVWTLIEAAGTRRPAKETIYDDLRNVVELRRVFTETVREQGLARVIFLLGPSGSGKTSALRSMAAKHGPRIVSIRANVTWDDRPMTMLGHILEALNVKDVPVSRPDRLKKTVEKLNEVRRCLHVEDAHHLGPRCLNLVVTLIDETPGEVVLAAIDSLWRKLETKAYEECRQLTGNRLAERVSLGRDVDEKDAERLLERGVSWASPDDLKTGVRLVVERAANYGRLAFIREVIERVNNIAGTEPVTSEQFIAAVKAEVESR